MRINVVEEVAEGRAHVSWAMVRSTFKGKTLIIYVFRDAMKFNGVPALQWDWNPVPKSDPWYTDKLFDGVRLPSSAHDLQMVADLTGCMMLTPLVIDMLWLQAKIRFDSITQTQRYPDEDISNDSGLIVANSHIHVLHQRIEAAIAAQGGDDGVSLIECVGKYWCLINELNNTNLLYGVNNACNYGWCAHKASGPGITPGVQCWQRPGFKHDHNHWDPSQVIRLMYHKGIVIHENGKRELADLRTVAGSAFAGLLHHEPGKLTYLRQRVVPEPLDDIAMPQYAPLIELAA